MSEFSTRMRLLRENADLLQAEVADALRISRSTLSQYETGKLPSLSQAIAIAKYYHVSLDYLLGLSDDRTRATSGMVPMFATLENLTGNMAPTSADIVALWTAAINYMVIGQPCGMIPLTALRDIMKNLTACLNDATQRDGAQMLDHANAAAVAALEITKMPAIIMAGKKEDK